MKILASQPARFSFRLSLLSALVAACIAAPCALISAPAFAASYDCSKGGSANEKLICNDPELSALDDKLGKTYKQARKKSANRHAFAVASDKQWQWREQNCHDRSCLVDWYHQRQAALEAMLTAEIANSGETGNSAAQAAIAVKPAEPAAAADKSAKQAVIEKTEKPVAKTAKPVKEASAASQSATPGVAATSKAATPAPLPSVPVVPAVKPAVATTTARVTTAATATPVVASTVPAVKPAKQKLQLNLSPTQIANIAPEGASARGHFLSANKGEYLYTDPDGDEKTTISVHYLGIEHGQYIIEARRQDVYTRYTCSADCSLIGELRLPGDVETDMVILKNDHRSLPSLIVTDAVNGLLLESVAVRNN